MVAGGLGYVRRMEAFFTLSPLTQVQKAIVVRYNPDVPESQATEVKPVPTSVCLDASHRFPLLRDKIKATFPRHVDRNLAMIRNENSHLLSILQG